MLPVPEPEPGPWRGGDGLTACTAVANQVVGRREVVRRDSELGLLTVRKGCTRSQEGRLELVVWLAKAVLLGLQRFAEGGKHWMEGEGGARAGAS